MKSQYRGLAVGCLAIAAAAFSGACHTDPAGTMRPGDVAEVRVYTDVEWEKRRLAGGADDHTSLISPYRLNVSEAGVTLIDFYPKQIKRFAHGGTGTWTFGREGGGPGEFRNPSDLKLDALGRAWVLDGTNSRITVLSPGGAVEAQIPLAELRGQPHEIVPLRDNRAILLMGGQPETPMVIVNSEGLVERSMAFPAPEFTAQHYLASQQITASDSRTGRWISAYRLADGFVVFDQEKPLPFRGWFVEPIPFPKIVTRRINGGVSTELQEKPLSAARSATFSGNSVYVLYGGASADRNRVIDTYSADDGRYLHSYVLPEAVREIAAYKGGFYTIRDDPEPELAYWRPVGTTIP